MKIIGKSEIPEEAFEKVGKYHEIYYQVRKLDVGECLVVPSPAGKHIKKSLVRTFNSNWGHKRKRWPRVKVMELSDQIFILVLEKRENTTP